jgi:hypothetical protein
MVPSDTPSAPIASHTCGAGVPHDTDATKGIYWGDTRHAAGRQMIEADEVRLLSPKHHLLKSEQELEKQERCEPMDNAILRGHQEEGPRAGFLGQGIRILGTRQGQPRHLGHGNSSNRRARHDLQNPKCSCVTPDTVQPNSTTVQKGRRGNTL